jgi:T5SS/PEP-CTERM-associated repeat protein
MVVNDGAIVTSTNGRIGREAGSTGAVSVSGINSWWANTGVLTIGLAGTGTGDLVVYNGGLVTAAGGITIGPLGTVWGNGTLGTLGATVTNGGLVAPGSSPGAMYIQGNFTQTAGGTLQIEIQNSANDKLDVRGTLILGGTLDVVLNGFVPSGTHSFDILDWTGGISGTFSTLQLPTMNDTLIWDTSQLYTSGILSVTGPELAGDFNEDGNVDASDYVIWRNGWHSTFTTADYDTWRAHFGEQTGLNAGRSPYFGEIPEPSDTLLIFTIASVSASRRSVRRRI